MLFVVNTFNMIDRQLPSILVESIKADLALSDTQFGLLDGVAFALVYATLAFSLARLADRGSPTRVIAGAIGFWSLMTAVGGAAQSFWQLALARTGVAAGEAGCQPCARALISSVVRSIAARLGCRALFLRAGLLAERDLAEMNARATRVGGE